MERYIFHAAMLSLLIFSLSYAGRKEFSQIITVNDYTYEIDVGGWREPVNETIEIENLGDEPLVNPRITVNGRYDWFDMESIAREATIGCSTDKERALALFNFIRHNFQHLDSPGDRETHNPVVSLNVYGYANCAYHSSAMVSLARALGMTARVWEVWLHTISEIRYENSWHMIDSDIGLYYLMDDNRTIASVDQLFDDQRLSGGTENGAVRTVWSGRNKAIPYEYTDAAQKEYYLHQDGKRTRGYRYFFDWSYGWVYVQTGYDRFTYEPHSMAMTIRPGEKLVLNWQGEDKYYDYKRHNAAYERDGRRYRKPVLYGDGQLIWNPDLDSGKILSLIDERYCADFAFEDGVRPAVHTRYKSGEVFTLPNFVRFNVNTPYTILGGRLKAKVLKGGANKRDAVEIYLRSATGPINRRVWSAPEDAAGEINVELDLDEILYPSGERGRHEYTVGFQFTADEKNSPPVQSGLDSVTLITDIQCAPKSLPSLARGRNVVRYRDETPGFHEVKITHIWNERFDNHPPDAPDRAVYPPDQATVDDVVPVFRWSIPLDGDSRDEIVDHEICISDDPRCRWPLATALQTWTESGEPEWRIAPGWLNRDTAYYWMVRARDSRRVWGAWSEVFSFRTTK